MGDLRRAEEHLSAARAARRRVELDAHGREVDRLEAELEGTPPGDERDVLVRAAAAERMRNIGYVETDEAALREAAQTATEILAVMGRGRPDIAARLRLALAQAIARLRGPGWERQASQHCVTAARLFMEAGEADEAAGALAEHAYTVQLPSGNLRNAHSSMTEALSLTDDPSLRASFLGQRAQLHVWLGELDAAQSDIDAAWPLAQLGHDRGIASVAWAAATLASLRGQRSVVEWWVQRAEEHRGSWADGNVTGLWYEAAAVDALSRVGAVDAARERLAALGRHADQGPTAVGIATIAFEARWGDVTAALTAWDRLRERPDLAPWEAARLQLLLASARERLGMPAGPTAAEAFDLCAGLEEPAVLLTTEPAEAETLLPVAAAAGSTVAAQLMAARPRWLVRILGTFALEGSDRQLAPVTGRARRLLMYLAVAGGPVSRDHLARWLWPDVDDEVWRRERLRRVLHRVRSLAPGAVEVVEPGRLGLSADVQVDLERLTTAVRSARTAQDPVLRVAATRDALEFLGGELLPDEIVDDEWLHDARVRLARDTTWLHTVMAEHEAACGQDDAALGHARQALAAEPTNESAAALAVDLLRRHGHRGEAIRVLSTTEHALADLDLDPGPLLRGARRRLEGPNHAAD